MEKNFGKKSFSEILNFENSKRDIARELEVQNERLSPSKGGQRTYLPIIPLFLYVRGRGARRADEGNVIMIIVLSIFYVFGLQANTSPKSKWPNWKNHTQGLATGL